MKKSRKNNFDRIKAEQAARRKAHFAAGGTPAMWRGRAATLDVAKSKANQNRLACRGRVQEKEWK